jgi:hypothetical protein
MILDALRVVQSRSFRIVVWRDQREPTIGDDMATFPTSKFIDFDTGRVHTPPMELQSREVAAANIEVIFALKDVKDN